MGLYNITKNVKHVDSDSYNDIPDYSGYCPDCPQCGETMKYSYSNSEFKCYNCGYIMDEDDWEYDEDEEMPWVCSNCGGPWPSCTTSCKMFDE